MAESKSIFIAQTFDFIAKTGWMASKYSRAYGVPELAIVGSVANEYDARYSSIPQIFVQGIADYVADASISTQQNALQGVLNQNFDAASGVGTNTFPYKFFWNQTAIDVGPGNIRISTAVDIVARATGLPAGQGVNASNLARYSTGLDKLVDDLLDFENPDASYEVAAAVLRDGVDFFSKKSPSSWNALSRAEQEALLVTYYKVGPEQLSINIAARMAEARRSGDAFAFNPRGDGGAQHLVNRSMIEDALPARHSGDASPLIFPKVQTGVSLEFQALTVSPSAPTTLQERQSWGGGSAEGHGGDSGSLGRSRGGGSGEGGTGIRNGGNGNTSYKPPAGDTVLGEIVVEATTPGKGSKTNPDRSGKPILIDLDGNGLTLTKLGDSVHYFDIAGDGYAHRTAWAGAGDGVLVFDADGDGKISSRKEVVLTDWDPSADTDMEALRQVFDTNGNGLLDAGDAQWQQFKVMVTKPDGTTVMKTLVELGIQSLTLVTDEASYEYADGSSVDGEASFTRTDGTTGKAATATFAIDANGYAVTTTQMIDSNQNTVVTTRAQNTDGSLAAESVRTTSADGLTVTTRFDDDGDGVTDRVLSDVTETLTDGSARRTEAMHDGAGVLVRETTTTTSADRTLVEIERDEIGGGFATETETQETHADGSLTITVSKTAADGSVISTRRSELSADRLERTEFTDADGNGIFERSSLSGTVRHADGSITKRDEVRANNGSLLSQTEVNISVDGLVRSEVIDLNGDGLIERTVSSATSRDPLAGTITTTEQIKDRAGNLLSGSTSVSSNDGLSKSSAIDGNGDGIFDRLVTDVTVIGVDQSRTQTVTTSSADGSLLSKAITVRAVDGLTGTKSIDSDGDGLFDQITTVLRNAALETIQTTTNYSADGVGLSSSIATTSADGLTTVTELDRFGEGVSDRVISDVVIHKADGSAEHIVGLLSGNGTLLERTLVTESSNGLVVRSQTDLDGDSHTDVDVLDTTVVQADGSQIRTVANRSGNGDLLTSASTITSHDRLTIIRSVDADGDGAVNHRQSSQTQANGSKTIVEEVLTNTGNVISTVTTSVSANGLDQSVEFDLDGNGTIDRRQSVTTVLSSDGGKTVTSRVHSGNQLLLREEIISQSGNGMVTTKTLDANGDGIIDESIQSETTLNADGSMTASTIKKLGTTVAGSESKTQGGNGLNTLTATDLDGDGDADLTVQVTKQLLANGSVTETQEVRATDQSLISSGTATTSANGKIVTSTIDRNGDGIVDQTRLTEVLLDGSRRTFTAEWSASGAVESSVTDTIGRSGLTATRAIDLDGDGVADRTQVVEKIILANGSEQVTTTDYTGTTTVVERDVTTKSGNGLESSTVWSDAAGATTRSLEKTKTLAVDGSSLEVETFRKADGSLESSQNLSVSGNGTLSVLSRDADGDGNVENRVTNTKHNDGTITSLHENLAVTGTVSASKLVTVSADGLTTTTQYDSDGTAGHELRVTSTVELLVDGGTKTTVSKHALLNDSWQPKGSTITTTSGDGLTTTVQSDDTGSGVFGVTRSSQAVLGTDGARTTTNRTIVNGTVAFVEERRVSANGLSVTDRLDFDGNGVFDQTRTDSTVLNADGSKTRSEITRKADGTTISTRTTTTAKDGLSWTVSESSNLQGAITSTTAAVTELLADGGSRVTKTISQGSSTERETVTTSGDGKIKTVERDLNNDGAIDHRQVETRHADGRVSVWKSMFSPAGQLLSSVKSSTSANGLLTVIETDKNGDGIVDLRKTINLQDNADGSSKTITTLRDAVTNALKSRTEQTISADGTVRIETTDVNGDGTADQTVREEILPSGVRKTTITNNGAAKASSEIRSGEIYWSDAIPSAIETIVSADGMTKSIRMDVDGNGTFEVDASAVTQADGSVITTIVEKNANGTIKTQGTLTQNHDGIVSVLTSSTTGVGGSTVTTRARLDGSVEKTTVKRNSSGVTTETTTSSIDALGYLLTSETRDGSNRKVSEYARQGDLTARRTSYQVSNGAVASVETLNADGKLSAAVIYDALNNQAWSRVEQTYDTADKKILEKQFLDNGTRQEFTYDPTTAKVTSADIFNAAGVRTMNIVYDAANASSWSRIETQYDSLSRQTYQFTYYDNGNRAETQFDAANAASWYSITNTFDATGYHVDQSVKYDAGHSTKHTYHRGGGTSNQVTGIYRVEYSYDAMNRLTMIVERNRQPGGSGTFELTNTKTYDYNNSQSWNYYVNTQYIYKQYDKDRVGSSWTTYWDDGRVTGGKPPVVLDLDGDGIVSISENTDDLACPRFDWDGDGISDKTAWVGPQDGLLVIDLAADGNAGSDGVIDQASEVVFADWAPAGSPGPITDLEGLRLAFDTNHDNILDPQDERWSEFRVWQDLNQNGISDTGELRTLTEVGIKLINLLPNPAGAMVFADGSMITGTSSYETVDGLVRLVADTSLAYTPSRLGQTP